MSRATVRWPGHDGNPVTGTQKYGTDAGFAMARAGSGCPCLCAGGDGWPAGVGEETSAATDAVAAAPEAARRFETEVTPLLARRCLECHDAAANQGGLDLSQRDAVPAGGESGPAVVPGRPEESLLWQYVSSDRMPKDRPPLTGEEKRSLAAWIAEGAPWTLEVLDAGMASGRWRGEIPGSGG